MKELKLVHKPLHCPVCGERFMNMFGQPLPNHAQIRCLTLTGDEMDIGICENCISNGVSLEMVSAVLQGIKDYWTSEITADRNLNSQEKQERIALHKSHKIQKLSLITRTGKEAEKKIKDKDTFTGLASEELENKGFN